MSVLDHMTLDELLRRKAVDYGYGTLKAMAEAMGIKDQRLKNVVNARVRLSLEMRRLIIRELDVAPEVLERMI